MAAKPFLTDIKTLRKRAREHMENGAMTPGYVEGENLTDMIKEDLVAERIAIDSYREMVIYLQKNYKS